jgi:hypothetical protein
MNPASLKRAVAEAQRFIAVAKTVKIYPDRHYLDASKETAAAKRASMDLTRALAEMRRPL